ncbi:unnamed protein product [Symbiodinium microadriaticum]|nr:unnamed protein product [Symbiodinium microadriaticum]
MTIRNRYGRTLSEESRRLARRAKLLSTITGNTGKLNSLGDVADFDVPQRAEGNAVTLYIKPDADDEYALKRINKRLGTTLTVGQTESVKMSRITVAVTVKKGREKQRRQAAIGPHTQHNTFFNGDTNMPTVIKEENYVSVGYELCCGYERANALADDLCKVLADDKGLHSAEDKTTGFWPDNRSLVEVTYRSLADCLRLAPKVRELLSRKADYTYEAVYGTSYGQRGPSLTIKMPQRINCHSCRVKMLFSPTDPGYHCHNCQAIINFRSEFVDYCLSFYGEGGIYDMGATRNQVIGATRKRLDDLTVPFDGDTIDRERVRDILIEEFGLVWLPRRTLQRLLDSNSDE